MPERIYDKDNLFDKLKALMHVLRENCPWDRRQTLSSLRQHTLEETHEVLEAIERAESKGDWNALKDELGDLLFQILFYAQIASEQGRFDLEDVSAALIEKMIRRHPHVFGGAEAGNASSQWEHLKRAEHGRRKSRMDGIPPLPALAYAKKQQQRAAAVGFDWQEAVDVIAKMQGELDELAHEVRSRAATERLEDEFGDVLFALVNLGRKLGLDAELALMRSNRKFETRFRVMERLAAERGLDLHAMSASELEALYEDAKSIVRTSSE